MNFQSKGMARSILSLHRMGFSIRSLSSSRFDSIPVFDLQHFSNSGIQQRKFIERLRNVCHNVGFFYVKNHNVSPRLVTRVFESTKLFFDLPQQEKNALQINRSPHFRGYGKLGAEITEGIPDYKETFDLGLNGNPCPATSLERRYLTLLGPNQWPASLEHHQWKETMSEYILSLRALGEQLMKAMTLCLGLPEDLLLQSFCAEAEDSFAMLRLLRYPPSERALGVGPHIDSGCLVILLQDETGGLQVQNCDGQWIDAPPIPNTFVVNIGKMLQIWSNNYFLATPHQVINRSRQVRYSVPFFFEPNLSTEVKPLILPAEILSTMKRPPIESNTRVVYGEHMLSVYERSFPVEKAKVFL